MLGDVQHSHRADHDVEFAGLAVFAGERPPLIGIRPPQRRDTRARDEMLGQIMVGGDLLDVREDLRLVGEGLAPAGVQRERVGVEVRRHVARRAGVGVLAPGPAEVVAAVEDREVISAAGELDAHRDPAKTRADDCHRRLVRRCAHRKDCASRGWSQQPRLHLELTMTCGSESMSHAISGRGPGASCAHSVYCAA